MEKAIIAFDRHTDRIVMRHGPIDLFARIDADDQNVIHAALGYLSGKFGQVLPSLCAELPVLRSNVGHIACPLKGIVGKKMYDSAARVSDFDIVTPMIAVAGSVADHICELIDENFATQRIIVNNGGDIAFRLGPGQSITVGICDDVAVPQIPTTLELGWRDGIGGIATSGWRGRSFSLGIADAVTVLAENASQADATATLIANAVDLPGSRKVIRQCANELAPDSDLGAREVTIDVGVLAPCEIDEALSNGAVIAERLKDAGLIHSACLSLKGRARVISSPVSVQTGPNSRHPGHRVV